MSIKAGWPYRSYDGEGMSPEVRSLAAADLDNDGTIEIVAANTQTDEGEPQVYVLSPNGTLYQPPGLAWQAWPRYNTATGPGNDADANGAGNHGYGCYGLNLGVGNLDDDPELEIVVTFDNHQVNVFDHDGVSHLASDYYRNRSTAYYNNRLNWGQMIRWFDPAVEAQHYHEHLGEWPSPEDTPWCQWTASPCNVVDLNDDGRNEVVGVPNIEWHIPYETIHHSVMVLEGSYGDGSRSARRLTGWENPPSSDAPLVQSEAWYPPRGIPAPTTVDLSGDGRPEIIVPMNDGYVYAFSPEAQRLWRYDIRHGAEVMYASEVLVCDLNQDNVAELIFTTYGDPESVDPGVPHGYLVVLDRQGALLHDVELPIQGTNGNGKGAPAAPTLGDLDGDGTLEIVVQTFAGNCFVYSVPGSSTNSMPWPTARGSYLRQGRAITSSALPPPEILGITIAGDNVTIEWKAGPNTRQSLECSEDLAATIPAWTVLRTFEPPTATTNSHVDTPLHGKRYYRVRTE
ncbi:MAG TPA: VCBS repeat-containing protein [Kiritimatiellia bacterium]|nr:VCBS repeat-containing protein [Kiritimatiellia bacterium]